MSRPRPGALRVVAGTAGGLRLEVPPGSTTRPTADRVRQAIFNALDSLDAVEDAAVLDPFAGSGALAIEALSRGAASATLCETSAAARQVIEANLAATGFADRARVVAGPGERTVAAGGPWDLVLLDPPYDFADWDGLLARLVPSLAERREDSPSLVAFYLNKFNKEMEESKQLTPEALRVLERHNWPGNIRE